MAVVCFSWNLPDGICAQLNVRSGVGNIGPAPDRPAFADSKRPYGCAPGGWPLNVYSGGVLRIGENACSAGLTTRGPRTTAILTTAIKDPMPKAGDKTQRQNGPIKAANSLKGNETVMARYTAEEKK